MKRYCLALDLKEDAQLIAEYEELHQNIWPQIKTSIFDAGILSMEIYRVGVRMFMIMETNADFSFEAKNKADAENPKVQEWENFMWKFQQSLPSAKNGEKWIMMNKIFDLNK
jgi:L-rhamnose mutarotase